MQQGFRGFYLLTLPAIIGALFFNFQGILLAEKKTGRLVNLHQQVKQEIHLKVSLSRRQVTIYKGAVEVKRYPLGVGRSGWETPAGNFSIVQMERDPIWMNPLTGQIVAAGDPANPLGRYWMAFSIGGRMWYGFHSTNEPHTVGQAISHGCLRMHTQDAEELFSLVKLGTPVTIVP